VTGPAPEPAARACRALQHDIEATAPGSATLSIVALKDTRLAGPAVELAARTSRDMPELGALTLYIDYAGGQAAALPLVEGSLAGISVLVAEELQRGMIEMLGRAWPVCVFHGRHPMIAAPDFTAPPEAVAHWHCPVQMSLRVPIGELHHSRIPGVEVPNGTVRWWLPSAGHGMIADEDGDIWVTIFELAADRQDLVEGDRVTYEVEDHRTPSGYRRALSVRRA